MFTISTLRIEKSDWLYNAGIVGLVNILEHNEDYVKKTANYIEIDYSVLENFEDKYFSYLGEKYLEFTGWYRIVQFQDKLEKMKSNGNYTEEDLDSINNQIDFLKKKLKSNSYVKGYMNIGDKSVDLKSEGDKLSKLKVSKKKKIEDIQEDIKEQISTIETIIQYCKKEEVKKHLIAKDLAYTVINNFWNGVSFLHKKKSEEDIYNEYNNHFVKTTFKYLQNDNSSGKYSCFNCDAKMLKADEGFNLSWLQSIGVDGDKKASHFWNLTRDDLICPVCNLIYSCIPAGFTFLKGKGVFVNNNAHLDMLVKSNRQIIKSTDGILELEYKSYAQISEAFNQYSVRNIKREYENIQIVKLDTEKQFAQYTFNILSKEMVKFLDENKARLSVLLNKRVYWYSDASGKRYFKYLYKEVIDRMYRGENLFSIIDFSLNKAVREEFYGFNEIELLLKLNVNFIERGGLNMDKKVSDKKIFAVRQLGYELKEAYAKRGLENKTNGMLYRMLNAVKVKDASKFLDSLINAYSYINKEIPKVFIGCLGSDDTFQTLGYAFILGLKGSDFNSKDNKEEK